MVEVAPKSQSRIRLEVDLRDTVVLLRLPWLVERLGRLEEHAVVLQEVVVVEWNVCDNGCRCSGGHMQHVAPDKMLLECNI